MSVSEGGGSSSPIVVPAGKVARSPHGLVRATPLRMDEARRVSDVWLLIVLGAHVVLHHWSRESIARAAKHATEVHLHVPKRHKAKPAV